MRLEAAFYQRPDVVQIARELLGKTLVTNLSGELTSGIICETEAYAGVDDRASHAFGGRRTARTDVMFFEGGYAYVYLCYGIHNLFNVVTNYQGIPHAVLIRGIIPSDGLEIIAERRNRKLFSKIGIGPGNVSKSLGIDLQLNQENLIRSNKIWIENSNLHIPLKDILATPRIGVDYAGEDAKLPYRFVWKNQATIK
ncbi:MAG: DNA-3-methyladenine glycosylase [Bacteroidetes bacterium]|nr:DNA-3-methyladenine glycosylase [Bacteroidota bacterium]